LVNHTESYNTLPHLSFLHLKYHEFKLLKLLIQTFVTEKYLMFVIMNGTVLPSRVL